MWYALIICFVLLYCYNVFCLDEEEATFADTFWPIIGIFVAAFAGILNI